MMENVIDIVIPWVDGNDFEWQMDKEKYDASSDGDKRVNRYRDWDNLEYWFRGVEKFLPWVRKIHFVTYGHLPKWLNTDNPRLNIVKHSDYIPEKYLPIFNSHPIEMNFHRIEGLSEQFIYANDDMFFIRPMKSEDFFQNGYPKDCAIESVLQFKKGGIDHIIANNLEVLNANFNKREVLKREWKNWYNIKYGKKMLKSLYFAPCGNFVGFENPHIPFPYLKRTFQEIWEKEPEILNETCLHKFRNNADVNQWLARYWQFANGDFMPGNTNLGKFYVIGKDDKEISEAIVKQSYSMICLSDDNVNIDYDKEKNFLRDCFSRILPEKSNFEK